MFCCEQLSPNESKQICELKPCLEVRLYWVTWAWFSWTLWAGSAPFLTVPPAPSACGSSLCILNSSMLSPGETPWFCQKKATWNLIWVQRQGRLAGGVVALPLPGFLHPCRAGPCASWPQSAVSLDICVRWWVCMCVKGRATLCACLSILIQRQIRTRIKPPRDHLLQCAFSLPVPLELHPLQMAPSKAEANILGQITLPLDIGWVPNMGASWEADRHT